MTTISAARSGGHKLLLMTMGSRGDVQPIIALGSALQQAGFAVRVFTNSNYTEFVRAMGLDVVGSGVDSEKLIREDPRLLECMAKGDILKFVSFLGEVNTREFPGVMAKKIEVVKAWKPDLIISSPLDAFEAYAIAGAEAVPLITMDLQCTLPSKEQRSSFAEPQCFPHRILGTIFSYVFWKSEHDSKAQAVKEQLPEGEAFIPTSLRQLLYLSFHPIAPALVGFSPFLKPVPADFPEGYKARLGMAGFWTIAKAEQEALLKGGDARFGGEERAALEAFLAQGAPPVYIGWGSMVSVSAAYMTCLAVRALMQAGMRGIVLEGYAGLGPGLLAGQPDSESLATYAAEHVLFLSAAPHEWLFPQCSVIVHHGGAGTTAAALRSGVPAVVTPIAFDQFDHADLVAHNGCGVGMPQISKLKAGALAAALKRCADDEGIRQRSSALAKKLQGEDGLGTAVRVIDDFIADEVKTGKWRANFEAQSRGMKSLKSRRPPSCLAWCARLCCSAAPNDYSVKTGAAGVST